MHHSKFTRKTQSLHNHKNSSLTLSLNITAHTLFISETLTLTKAHITQKLKLHVEASIGWAETSSLTLSAIHTQISKSCNKQQSLRTKGGRRRRRILTWKGNSKCSLEWGFIWISCFNCVCNITKEPSGW